MSLDNMLDLLERYGYQRVFKNYLIQHNGLVEGHNSAYNKEYAIDEEKLFTYLQTTQEKEYEKVANKLDFKSKFIKYLREEIHNRGLLNVFRGKVKYNGAHFDMLISRPHNKKNPAEIEKYNQNIVSVTEELAYSENSAESKRGDLTIFVNGLPLIWIELKSNSAGQSILDAKKQYYKDRNPNELIFRFKEGCLVYFAIDLEEAAFATRLNKENTYFMPYNKKHKKVNDDIAEDTQDKQEDSIRTSYMWEEILTKDNILEWLEHYIVYESKTEKQVDGKKKTTDTIIFPRYHQFHEVNEILNDIRVQGVNGQNYLIMDSPGSGKTYSIAWLAHHLAYLHDCEDKPIYNTVIVITDRLVVDKQLQEAVLAVPHVEGTVETMGDDCTSEELKNALNNETKIIVSSIQKFSFILDKVSPMSDKKFAIIIDECHSSTKGTYMTNVGKALSQDSVSEDDEETDDEDYINEEIQKDLARSKKHVNLTLIGYSATPKKKTLQLFGTKYQDGGEIKYRPFAYYSMRQAIDEGFILDVLKNYTTYKTYFEINKKIADNPEFNKKKLQKAVLKYANLQDENIEQKVEIIVEHFLDKVAMQLDGNAKAMVVTDGREAAVRYKLAFERYFNEHNITNLKALVAFTGKVHLQDDETEYSETKMNGFPESQTKDNFNTTEYRILLVANKYQTGYDQKLLVAMYVDKQLVGPAAVQTLGRLNRTCSGKTDVFVLDFRNDYDSIVTAFKPYYETLELLGEMDPNKLYQLEQFIDEFKLINEKKLDEFIKISLKDKRSDEDVCKWNGILSNAKSVYDSIPDEDNRRKLRKSIIKFTEGYYWIIQVCDFEDKDLHKKSIFFKYFARYLRTGDGEKIDAAQYVDVVKFKQRKTRIGDEGGEISPITQVKVGQYTKVSKEEEIVLIKIDDLIAELNERYGLGIDKETQSPFVQQLLGIFNSDGDVETKARNNTEKDFQLFVEKKLESVLATSQEINADLSDRILENIDVKNAFARFITGIIYRQYH